VQYSVVNCSEVMSHKDKRMDSEHYHPCHLNNLEKYKGKSKRLGDYILHMSGGATPLGAIYPETGIPFLRVETSCRTAFPNQTWCISRMSNIKPSQEVN